MSERKVVYENRGMSEEEYMDPIKARNMALANLMLEDDHRHGEHLIHLCDRLNLPRTSNSYEIKRAIIDRLSSASMVAAMRGLVDVIEETAKEHKQ